MHITHPDAGVIVLIGEKGVRIDHGSPNFTANIPSESIEIPRRNMKQILFNVKMIA